MLQYILHPRKKFVRPTPTHGHSMIWNNIVKLFIISEISKNLLTIATRNFSNGPRIKRQITQVKTEFNVEVLFVVDYAIYEWYFNLTHAVMDRDNETVSRIEKHYAEVLIGIDDRYRSIDTKKFNIRVSLAGIIIAKDRNFSYWTETYKLPPIPESRRWMVPASPALDSFLLWVNQTTLPEHDHAILFTGYNLTYGGSGSYLGLSFANSVCSPDAVSIVEDSFDTKTTVAAAQEIGRSVGSRQDLDGNFCLDSDLFIMTPSTWFEGQYVPNLWSFSNCSDANFKDFLENFREGSNCLKTFDSASSSGSGYTLLALDDTDTADQQCRNVYGEGSFVCRAYIRFDYSSVCKGLPCWDPDQFVCQNILPYDGTICGNYSTCNGGICSRSNGGKPSSDECPYGDQPILPNNSPCDIKIYSRPYDCYRDSLRAVCCKSCDEIKTDIADCEYGDRISTCNLTLCSTYDNTTRDVGCCLTCTNGKTPYSALPVVPLTTVTQSSTNITSSNNITLPIATEISMETSTRDIFTDSYGTSLIGRLTPFPKTTTGTSTSEISTTETSETETPTTETSQTDFMTSTNNTMKPTSAGLITAEISTDVYTMITPFSSPEVHTDVSLRTPTTAELISGVNTTDGNTLLTPKTPVVLTNSTTTIINSTHGMLPRNVTDTNTVVTTSKVTSRFSTNVPPSTVYASPGISTNKNTMQTISWPPEVSTHMFTAMPFTSERVPSKKYTTAIITKGASASGPTTSSVVKSSVSSSKLLTSIATAATLRTSKATTPELGSVSVVSTSAKPSVVMTTTNAMSHVTPASIGSSFGTTRSVSETYPTTSDGWWDASGASWSAESHSLERTWQNNVIQDIALRHEKRRLEKVRLQIIKRLAQLRQESGRNLRQSRLQRTAQHGNIRIVPVI